MSGIFLHIVNMSISAGYLVLAVLLIRLLLKKAPRWLSVLLWGIVGVRLVSPFSLESVLSLIPSAETISPNIMTDTTPSVNTGIPIVNNTVNPIIGESFAPDPSVSVNPLQVLIPILALVWAIGVLALLLYAFISYFRVRRKVGTAVLQEENIYRSESVISPFVLGLIKPKIYLPFNMKEDDLPHVIAHERAHISRRDHLWKPIGFLLLSLHWFNPLMWLGYVLLCRDIELACDERVIKSLDREQRADYSQALLALSVNRRMISACPLAFGEVGVKDRVKSVLNYKKPAFWVIIVAVVALVVLAVCFLTNPKKENDQAGGEGETENGGAETLTPNYGETDPEKLTPEQLALKEKYPEYFGLDAANGLDVAFWESTAGSYCFGFFTEKAPGTALIARVKAVSAEQMRSILATYDVTPDQVRILIWTDFLSSHIPKYAIGKTKEEVEEKQRLILGYARELLFGDQADDDGEETEGISLIFHAPAYDWVTSDVPKVQMNGGKLYDADTGELLGSVVSRSMDCFSALSQMKDYSDSEAALADKLWVENKNFYEVTPATLLKGGESGVGPYYVMEQTDGSILLVYGHYENGEKTGFIRWIFDLGK